MTLDDCLLEGLVLLTGPKRAARLAMFAIGKIRFIWNDLHKHCYIRWVVYGFGYLEDIELAPCEQA